MNGGSKKLALIVKLRGQAETKFVQLAIAMREAFESGEATVQQLQTATGYGYRRVNDLMSLGKALKQKKLTKAMAVELGSSRATMVAPKLLKGALKAEDLPALVGVKLATLAKTLDPNDEPLKVFAFHLNSREADALTSALTQMGALRHGNGLRCKEEALMTLLVRAQSAVAKSPDLKAAA